MQVNSRLKELRKQRGLTQVEVAQIVGLTVATYSRYEKGLFKLESIMLCKLAEYYGVSVDYILMRTNDPRMYKDTPMADIDFLAQYARLNEANQEILVAIASVMEKQNTK